MGVLTRDPASTAATLARWLRAVAGTADPAVTDVSIPGATGWSNETILFDAAWGEGDDRRTRRLVARIAPSGHQVFPDETFLRQHTVMRALSERSDVPMARIHWLETDPSWFGRPFWIMDHVAGDVPTDNPPYAGRGWLHDANPEQQARAWDAGVDAMAAVHRVDLVGLGLPAGTYPAVDDTLAWHLDHYERFLAWAEDGTPHEPTGRGWRVTVEGTPSMVLDARIAVNGEDDTDQGCLGTAMHAVHAIAPVCAAEPGIRTFLDLPTIAGRGVLG
jgi:aminoglycoside phosphotransferase (APT) family kinase protein